MRDGPAQGLAVGERHVRRERVVGDRVGHVGHDLEVGAGGGSIAWIDDSGALRVGPHSAGAEPGPVCYGRGGSKPTVTDANVVNGYINPTTIANATIRIDRHAAWEAIKSQIADPLGLDTREAAYGISQIANSAMMRALRAVSTERGRDPRDFTLVSFGGAGPIHAAALADDMEISEVFVPVFPGLFSALGLLLADYRHDSIRSVVTPLAEVDPGDISQRYAAMQNDARDIMQAEGISSDGVRFEHYVDLKYDYQLQELTIPSPMHTEPENLLDFEREKAGRTFSGQILEILGDRWVAASKNSSDRYPGLPFDLDGLDSVQARKKIYQKYVKDFLRSGSAIDDNIGKLLDYLDANG